MQNNIMIVLRTKAYLLQCINKFKGNINHCYTYQRVSTCYILKLQKKFFFL